MFFKVFYKETKLVVSFNLSSAMTIADLIVIIQKQLNGHLGTNDIYIPELLTGDGYYINPTFKVSDVLKEGDLITIPSYDNWLAKTVKLCDDNWLSVSRDDLRDSKQKVATVGRNRQNKIYVKFCLNNYITGPLNIIEPSKFNGQTKCTDTIIATVEDTKDGKWFIEARYWLTETSIIQGIELHVKSASEKSEWVDAIPISLGKNDVLVKGNMVHIKGSENAMEEEEEIEYTLPPTVTTGEVDLVQEEIQLTRHSPEGDCPIKMSWKKDGGCYVNHSSGSSKFTAYLSIGGVQLLNDSDKATAIVDVEAVYKNAAEEWIEVGGTQVGKQRPSTWPEFDWKKEIGFTMDAMQTDLVAFCVAIPCVGTSGNDNFQRSRLPQMLPRVLEVKVIIRDSTGRTSSVIFEHANKPVVLPTLEKYCKENTIPIEDCKYVYCDDCDATTRSWAAISIKKNVVRVQYSAGRYWEYKQFDLNAIAFKAKEKPAPEYLLDGMTHDGFRCYACVDLQREKLYAFKLVITTSTGSKTEYVKLPNFVRPTPGLKPNAISVPEKVKLGRLVQVSVRLNPPGGSEWIGVFPVDSEGHSGYLTYVYIGEETNGVVFIDPSSSFKAGAVCVCRYVNKANEVVCQSNEFTFEE
jgi:hypothetical protein